MHPIERLRYVARASGADPVLLVQETAGALASLGVEPSGIVTACRRVVDRHLASGPLWWLCARVLCAPEPRREAWACAERIADDPTPNELAHALPDDATVCVVGWPGLAGEALARRGDIDVLCVDVLDEGRALANRLRRAGTEAEVVPPAGLGAAAAASDLVLLEASAVGPTGFLSVAGAHAAAAVAYTAGVPVWVVAGVGRVLPEPMWDALVRRFREVGEPWEGDDELVPLALVGWLCGEAGPEPVDAGLARCDCPVTPELFRSTAF